MTFVKQRKQQIILLLIIALGAFLRLYGINWDQGFHLHPDERAIVMFTIPIHFPSTLDEFFSPGSPLNPHFFAYGNFPLYLLKSVSLFVGQFDISYVLYDKINLVGRLISALADLGAILILFLITRKLFTTNTALVASSFYAIAVFPIQAAHFYAVDTLLTFFIMLTLYQLVRFYEKPSVLNSALAGIFFGLSLVTKISAIPLIIAIIFTVTADFLLIIIRQPHKPHIWFPHVPRFLKRLVLDGIIITTSTAVTFALLQPYALIDFQEFVKQNLLQSQMTHNAFIFPYTLQYVGKMPYVYELKNVFFWGLGPFLASIAFMGMIYITFRLIRRHLGWWQADPERSRRRSHDSSEVEKKWAQELILLCFFWVYLFVVGKFSVGWMRYMLPLYPLFCLFAAVVFNRITISHILKQNLSLSFIFHFSFFIFILIWPLSFLHIYSQPNTRVLASQWIYQNIPPDKIIAREHWDDGLPIGGTIAYRILELPIYEMENPLRETQIYQTIQQADYIIIASNRLYAPLQKLSRNCQKWNLPPDRCSHNANRYYEKLFNEELGFQKVAEFAMYPTIPIINIPINDQSADESFTVYDHPKVMIFKKISLL